MDKRIGMECDENAFNAFLFSCVERNDYCAVNYLIKDNRAIINLRRNTNGWTILMMATYYGYEDMVKLAILYKADLDVQNIKGDTALMIAVDTSKRVIVKLLVDAGADVNKANKAGMTPLKIAEIYKDN